MTEGMLAHRYAQALLGLARDQDQLDSISEELEGLKAVIGETPELLDFLGQVIVPPRERRQVLSELVRQLKASQLLERYLNFLLEKERIVLLEGIIRAFFTLRDEAGGTLRAKVLSPRSLSHGTREKVEKLLAQKTGRQVAVDYKEDPTLVGGLVIQLGNRVLDGSVIGELSRFQEGLLKSAVG